MTTTINASTSSGIVATADGSGILKVQSNGVTTNALAWVNFNGTTSPGTIRAQYNVSSVTKSGTGVYAVNLTNALSDANYTPIVTTGNDSSGNAGVRFAWCNAAQTTPTTTSFGVTSAYMVAGGGRTSEDSSYLFVAVFGN